MTNPLTVFPNLFKAMIKYQDPDLEQKERLFSESSTLTLNLAVKDVCVNDVQINALQVRNPFLYLTTFKYTKRKYIHLILPFTT